MVGRSGERGERRRLGAARDPQRAALGVAAAARHRGDRRHLAGDRAQLVGVAVDSRDRAQQRFGIRMRRRRKSSATGASSTMSPAYITATRSAIEATTPRLWVMKTIAMPVRV